MTDNIEALGGKIRRLRQDKGFGQERLAIEANVDQSGLSKLERGAGARLGEAPLTRIATVLGLSFSDLVSGTDWRDR